jgi:hypothetical protein
VSASDLIKDAIFALVGKAKQSVVRCDSTVIVRI